MECKNGNHSCNSCGEKKCGNKHTTCHNADVVEIVRCEDCKWWHSEECYFRKNCSLYIPSATEFCSHGERKQNEQR